jgi:hypothetical protein
MALATKIKCNGVKPSKAEVYLLAAELVEVEEILGFRAAIIEAFKSYDYDYDYDYDYYYYDYYYYDYYLYYYDYDYDYDYSIQKKVIALLFLSAMYS